MKPASTAAKAVRRRSLALGLLVLLSALAGCTQQAPPGSRDGPPPSNDGDRYTYEDCDTVTVPFELNGTEWEAARVSCDANVTGTNEQALSCRQPEQAELTASTNLTSGQVELRVLDGDNETVAQHRVSDTNGEPRNLTIAEGSRGTWTLTAVRPEGFVGSFTSELACPSEAGQRA